MAATEKSLVQEIKEGAFIFVTALGLLMSVFVQIMMLFANYALWMVWPGPDFKFEIDDVGLRDFFTGKRA